MIIRNYRLGQADRNRLWKPPESIIGKQIALSASQSNVSRELYSILQTITPVDFDVKALPCGSILATARISVTISEKLNGFAGVDVGNSFG